MRSKIRKGREKPQSALQPIPQCLSEKAGRVVWDEVAADAELVR
jgi:hypothetical protein